MSAPHRSSAVLTRSTTSRRSVNSGGRSASTIPASRCASANRISATSSWQSMPPAISSTLPLVSPPRRVLPSFPAPSPAIVFMTEVNSDLSLRVGGWDAYRSNANGLFSDNNSALFIGEFEYRYQSPFRQLPGKFTAGATYQTTGSVPAGTIPRAFGYYVQIEQLLFREAGSTDDQPQGLTIFAQHFPTSTYGRSPFPLIPHDALAGLAYTGLIRGRDQDVTGAGAGWVDLDQGGTDSEIMVEVFYKAQINDALSIQPDLQYITTPSGIYPDAFVAGLRFQLDLLNTLHRFRITSCAVQFSSLHKLPLIPTSRTVFLCNCASRARRMMRALEHRAPVTQLHLNRRRFSPTFHPNIHHRFPLSRTFSNAFGAHSEHFAAHSA